MHIYIYTQHSEDELQRMLSDVDKDGIYIYIYIHTYIHTYTQHSEDELQRMLSDVDKDGTGEIEFEEFCHLMGVDAKGAKPLPVEQKVNEPSSGLHIYIYIYIYIYVYIYVCIYLYIYT